MSPSCTAALAKVRERQRHADFGKAKARTCCAQLSDSYVALSFKVSAVDHRDLIPALRALLQLKRVINGGDITSPTGRSRKRSR